MALNGSEGSAVAAVQALDDIDSALTTAEAERDALAATIERVREIAEELDGGEDSEPYWGERLQQAMGTSKLPRG